MAMFQKAASESAWSVISSESHAGVAGEEEKVVCPLSSPTL